MPSSAPLLRIQSRKFPPASDQPPSSAKTVMPVSRCAASAAASIRVKHRSIFKPAAEPFVLFFMRIRMTPDRTKGSQAIDNRKLNVFPVNV